MSNSFYTLRPDDPKAFYLDQGFGVCGDGKTDDTAAIQSAINRLYETVGLGILFIPEGEYVISDTLLIPQGVRLIGYGANRPRIRLADHAPGFDQPVYGDKGGSRYMLWYTSNLPSEPGGPFLDANAGTFYSTLENIDLYVGQGNTNAIAVRFHVAQNSFIAHCDFHIESGRAGIFDVGNESEDIHFYGGRYGIISTTCSPGWPFVLLDSSFEGQSEAAVRSFGTGFTAVRVQAKNLPSFLYVEDDNIEKLFMQDCLLENISDCAVSTDSELRPANQLNTLNIHCKNVPVFSKSRATGETVCAGENDYVVEEFHQGYVADCLGDTPHYDILLKTSSLADAAPLPGSDIPTFPDMSEWVNIHTLGARGDGRTDDTAAFRLAIANHRVIYIPQGVYILSDTITLKKDTILIGLHSYTTQLRVPDRTPAFADFGSPKALLEIPEGGDNLVNSFCIDTCGANQRISGIIWNGSEHSCLRDIKMNGGHGTMSVTNDARVSHIPCYNATGTDDYDPLRDWDNQYPSLWIKGGGIFKDIWSASTYAGMGMFMDHPSAPGKIYCMSLEHHRRREAHFQNVQGWSIYALQTEEVPDESYRAMALEFENCKDMLLANTFNYRVSRMLTPYPYAIKINNCENIQFYGMHNFAQSRYAFDNLIVDICSGKSERTWELTRMTIHKSQPRVPSFGNDPVKLYDGFWFADGGCVDSKGNFYFTDTEAKRIYRIDAKTLHISVALELVVKPFAVYCDTQDNLLILGDYKPSRTAPHFGPPPRFLNDRFKSLVVFTVQDGQLKELPLLDAAPDNAVYVYSGSRSRMVNNFIPALTAPATQYYAAPDGITVIPRRDDLFGARSLTAAKEGEDILLVDEFFGRTFRFRVGEGGLLCEPELILNHGECCAQSRDGKLYVCDGQVSLYSPEGSKLQQLTLPERPSTFAFGGKDKDILFITARTGLYACRL